VKDRPAALTRLLPLACLVAALCLLASDLITMFELAPPSAPTIESQTGGEHHGYAIAVVAGFAIAALAVAILAPSRPAAVAVAVAGAVALAIFLLVDLPDANEVGTVTGESGSYLDAEANPAGGFYLELISALALTITGLALALMRPEQLGALRPTNNGPGRGKGKRKPAKGKPPTGKRRSRKASRPGEAGRSAKRAPEAAKSKPGQDAGRAPKRA
jgi:hypothetical protein